MFKVFSQQLQGTLTITFWKTPQQLKVLRTWIKKRANSFIKTWVNIMKRKSMKLHGKIYLPFCYLIIDILWILKIILCLDKFFRRTSEILMRINVYFLWFAVLLCSYFLGNLFLPIDGKSNARPLNGRRNFWCLIFASSNVMWYEYLNQVIF